jgi:hypothetical protein
MRSESEICRTLRSLLTVQFPEKDWIETVAGHLGVDAELTEFTERLAKAWNPEWGSVSQGTVNDLPCLIWSRPDGGPGLADATEVPELVKLLRFMIHARLIRELRACGLMSFVTKDVPPILWRRCVVYRDGEEVELVVFADAILQQCEVLTKHGGTFHNKDGSMQTITLAGGIIIELGEKARGFF